MSVVVSICAIGNQFSLNLNHVSVLSHRACLRATEAHDGPVANLLMDVMKFFFCFCFKIIKCFRIFVTVLYTV